MVYELVQASGQPKSFPSNFTDILQLNSGFILVVLQIQLRTVRLI